MFVIVNGEWLANDNNKSNDQYDVETPQDIEQKENKSEQSILLSQSMDTRVDWIRHLLCRCPSHVEKGNEKMPTHNERLRHFRVATLYFFLQKDAVTDVDLD